MRSERSKAETQGLHRDPASSAPEGWAMFARASLCAAILAAATVAAHGQDGLGPFMPHNGGVITTAWANAYGPDAESYIAFRNVKKDSFEIRYTSTRGTRAIRRIRMIDRQDARTMILGYADDIPTMVPGTTTLGTSSAVLEELRSS